MSFESAEDLDKKKKAARIFVNIFGGSFSALSISDSDFKIFDSKKKLISYADVVIVNSNYDHSYTLTVSVSKITKLSQKRLNPVVIWLFNDGIVYTKLNNISGKISWGNLPGKESNPFTDELIAEFSQDKNFKYERG